MKTAFKVFKKGSTDNWVSILMVNPINGKPEQWTQEKINQKVNFYKSMGYEVIKQQ